MAKNDRYEIEPGSMWLPDPHLSPKQQHFQTTAMMAFINNVPTGVLKCRNDEKFTILRINDGFLKWIGYTRQELSSLFSDCYLNLIHPDDQKNVLDSTRQQLASGGSVSNEYRILCKNGSSRWITETGYCTQEEDGPVFFCTLTDITDLYETRENLRLSLDRHDIIMRQSKNIVFEWDKKTNSLLFSTNWAEVFGYPPLSALDFGQMTQRGHIAAEYIDILHQMLDEIVQGASFLSRECQIKTRKGISIWCRIQVTSQLDLNGNLIKAIGVIVNVDTEKRIIDSLRQKAERDPLTGLYDKAAIQSLIEKYLSTAPKSEQCALFMIDIDDFKVVNDTMGHLFGDAVLADFSASICRVTRSSDLVGRVGGDEFLVFLKAIPSERTALQKAQRFLSVIQNLFREKKNNISISCSIGISLFPSHGHDFRSLYQCADIALYQAKRKGKNTSCLYAAQMRQPALEVYRPDSPIDSDQTAVSKSSLSESLFRILYTTKDIEKAIPLMLEMVGRQFDVSRVYVFENSEDNSSCSNTFEWCNDGISSEKENLQNLSYDSLDHYFDNFNEDGIFFCQDRDSTPDAQRKLLQKQGVYSLLQCAIRHNGQIVGFVGVDECTSTRFWSEEEIRTLAQLSELFGTFLLQNRALCRAKKAQNQMRQLLDVQNAFLYVVDQENFQLFYLNKKMQQQYPQAAVGQHCYKAFFDRTSPCSGCPVQSGGCQIISLPAGGSYKISAAPVEWDEQSASLLTWYDVSEQQK